MASQEFDLGTSPLTVSSRWTGAILVDTELVDGGGTAYLREFGLSDTQSSIIMRFSASATSLPTIAGPQLIPEVEANPAAIVLSEAAGSSVTVRGPTTSGNQFSDTTDPYDWNPSLMLQSGAIDAFTTWIQGLGSGAVTLTLSDGDALSLADYDQTGKAIEALALIRAGSPNDIFQRAPDPASGTLLDGTLAIGPDDTAITRIRRRDVAGLIQVILRESDLQADGTTAAVLDSRAYFTTGAGSDLTLDLVTDDGMASVAIADNIDLSSGTNATQMRVDIPAADAVIVTGIAENDRFIVALWRSEGARIRADIRPGAPTMTARVRATPPPVRIRASITSGVPSMSAQIRVEHPGERRIQADMSSGAPTMTARVRTVPPPQRIRGDIRPGVPTMSARVRTTAPGERRIRGDLRSGAPTMTATVRTTPPASAPVAPTGLDFTAGHDFLDATWDLDDDGGATITGYEIRIGTGAWIPTRSAATTFRLGGLTAGMAYSITVRAINSVGTGPASAALAASTLPVEVPDVPTRIGVALTGGRALDLSWRLPVDDGGGDIIRCEVCVVPDFGEPEPFETAATLTSHRVRGLAFGHRYGFRVRAVNSAGSGPQSAMVDGTPAEIPTVLVPAGLRLPLIDTDRQSLIVRLGAIDCRVLVWWQPSNVSWYASLEVPLGTPVMSGRRLAVNAGLLAGAPDVLAGDVVCRAIDDTDVQRDPDRTAWGNETHGLFWEPAAA